MERMLFLAAVVLLSAGCVQQGVVKESPETIIIEPFVDNYFLGGYIGKLSEDFFLVSGDMDTAKQKARAILIGDGERRSEFGGDELLNFVVFRGVFSTGGFGLRIDEVERTGNTIFVHATYTDPGPGMMVTQAFTQPTAIVPIGILSEGLYQAQLRVTRVVKGEDGDNKVEVNAIHGEMSFRVVS